MSNYKFKFSVERINCDKFKQKQIAILHNVLDNSRLQLDMKFSNYATIEFAEDDDRHIYPLIEDNEGFNRLKTNCVVYNLLETDANQGDYDKCFIYQTNGAKGNGWFGFILYNSSTGNYVHKYYVDRTEDELCRQLTKSFNILRFRWKYAG